MVEKCEMLVRMVKEKRSPVYWRAGESTISVFSTFRRLPEKNVAIFVLEFNYKKIAGWYLILVSSVVGVRHDLRLAKKIFYTLCGRMTNIVKLLTLIAHLTQKFCRFSGLLILVKCYTWSEKPVGKSSPNVTEKYSRSVGQSVQFGWTVRKFCRWNYWHFITEQNKTCILSLYWSQIYSQVQSRSQTVRNVWIALAYKMKQIVENTYVPDFPIFHLVHQNSA